MIHGYAVSVKVLRADTWNVAGVVWFGRTMQAERRRARPTGLGQQQGRQVTLSVSLTARVEPEPHEETARGAWNAVFALRWRCGIIPAE